MQLTLIRHGETYWNELGKVQGQIDIELLPSGIEQAANLGQKMKLQMNQYSVIYCSQLKRAIVTAENIRLDSPIKIITDLRLNSRNLGDFSGLTLKQINEKYPTLYHAWMSGDDRFCPPNGENNLMLLERTRDFLKMLQKTYRSDEKIMLVTHRENVGVIFFLITKKKMEDPLKTIQNCTPYEIELTKSIII